MADLAVAPSKVQNDIPPAGWAQALTLACRVTVDVPLPGFKVARILRLQKNSVINTHWRLGTDAPLLVNGRVIAAGEFEAVGDHLAIRVTELA